MKATCSNGHDFEYEESDIKSHFVMCGDSTDLGAVGDLMDGVKMDALYTDPPYGMDVDTDYANIHTSRSTKALGGGKQRNHTNYEKVIADDKDFDASLFEELDIKEQFLWGADYYVNTIPNYGRGGSWIVWDKKPKGDMNKAIGNQFELCWSKVKHKRLVFDYTYSGAYGMKPNDGNRVHPTQKPVDLIAQMFEQWNLGDNILDLFLGSGSTLIACEQTDRTCYGMELDEKYLDVIRKRWAKYVYPDRWEKEWEILTPAIAK